MTYELKFVPSALKPTPFVHHYITCPHKYLFVRRCLAVKLRRAEHKAGNFSK